MSNCFDKTTTEVDAWSEVSSLWSRHFDPTSYGFYFYSEAIVETPTSHSKRDSKTVASIGHLTSPRAKVELLMLLRDEDDEYVTWWYPKSREWNYLSNLTCVRFGHRCYGEEPLAGAAEDNYQLAVGKAELDAFVEGLFDGGDELNVPGVDPSPALIPAVIEVSLAPAIVRL